LRESWRTVLSAQAANASAIGFDWSWRLLPSAVGR
jgi:hypothetical protein